MAIIDVRGESQQIAQNLTQLGHFLGELFGDGQQKALRFAMRNPELAVRMASAARAAIKSGAQPPSFGGDPSLTQGLLKLFPADAAEQEAEFRRAQITGPQQAALKQLEMITGEGPVFLSEATRPQRTVRDMMLSGATQEEILAAAPKLLEEHKKAIGLRTALVSARDIMTPTEVKQFETYLKVLDDAGEDAAEPFKPLNALEKVDMLHKTMELDAIKDVQEADRIATPWLIEHGYAPAGTTIVRGGAEFMRNEISKIRQDARQAQLTKGKQLQENIESAALGVAMETLQMHPDWTPDQVRDYMKTLPMVNTIPDGKLYETAVKAVGELRNIYAPKNDAEARRRVGYSGVKLALPRVLGTNQKEGLIDLGVRLNWKATLAAVDERQTAVGGLGLGLLAARIAGGAGKGGSIAGIPGALAGGIAGAVTGGMAGAVSAPFFRGLGRRLMNEEEQELFSLAENIAAAVYRTESGAAVRPDEVRSVINRYIPLAGEKKAVIDLKKQLLYQLDGVLANISGMPREQAIAQFDAFGARADAALSALGAKKIEDLQNPFEDTDEEGSGAGREWKGKRGNPLKPGGLLR